MILIIIILGLGLELPLEPFWRSRYVMIIVYSLLRSASHLIISNHVFLQQRVHLNDSAGLAPLVTLQYMYM